MKLRSLSTFAAGFLTCIVVLGLAASQLLPGPATAHAAELPMVLAAGQTSPTGALDSRDVYYPGTEALASDEMRVTACGTGMPNARPKQAAACWLVELGNGDKFLFDIGTGSAERISAMKIPMDYLDKVFVGHLHSDHFGDMDALWIGGVIGNRVKPLRVWGPSSSAEKYGTAYAMARMQEMFSWDVDGRKGNVDTRGLSLDVTEFDYRGVNAVIYEENGVTIRTIPAIHSFDGPVSFLLEWNGLKFAYSSDTFPNKWWREYATNVDLAVHECFATPAIMIEKQNFVPATALGVSTQIHTSPAQFGKVMAETRPRLAVGYHFFNDFDTQPLMISDVRKTYDGPLAMAVDYMVFNVTKDDIRVRMAVIDEDIWPLPATMPKLPPNPDELVVGFSDFIRSGRIPHADVVNAIYDEINAKYGTSVPYPGTTR